MTETSSSKRPRGGGGTLVLVVLAIVFFTVLGLMLLYWPTRAPVTPKSSDETLYVVPLELKLRTQATSKGAVVARARRGETVTLLEANGPWARVRNKEGLEGWAERNALEAKADRERRIQKSEAIRALPTLDGVVERTTQLFAGPGIFYPEMGSVTRAEKVKVHARDHDFYAIDVGNDIAWIEADDVDLSETAGARFEVAAADTEKEPEPLADLPPSEPVPDSTVGIAPEPREISSPSIEPLADGVYPVVPPGGTEPQLIHRVTPRYPITARRAGIEGPVIIRAIVRKDGTVDSAEILRDLPLGLGEAAREAVERWRFIPAKLDGQPIDVYYTVTVNYALTLR